MPVFQFRALDPAGKTSKGVVEADTQKNARLKLRRQGLVVLEIADAGGYSTNRSDKGKKGSDGAGSSRDFSFGAGYSGKDLALVTRQMASLIKANIPLVEALTALTEQTDRPKLKMILSQVKQDVNQGSSLSRALSKHPKAFDNTFINMVEAGETSGTMGIVLLKLAELREAQMRLQGKIVAGMTYPTLMMFVALGLMIAIFTFVIPKVTKLFESSKKPVPALTKFIMVISDFLVTWWFALIPALFFGTLAFLKYIRSDSGKPLWDAFVLRMPIFGPLVRMIAVTRFTRTMATLLGSSVPILNGMLIAKNIVGNTVIAAAVSGARENITEGQSIAEPLRRSGQFPPMVIHMIAVGERTGELPDMMKNVADTYEDQVNSRIETLTSLLEPIMIIGMGIMVGIMVMAVFIPLLDLNTLR